MTDRDHELLAPETLYFYVDGSDLHDVAPTLRQRFADFLASRTFVAGEAWLVDQVHKDDPSLSPGDLPDWDLGINLQHDVPPEARPANWFDDIVAIVTFLCELSVETGRKFVVGACFGGQPGEDLFYVGAKPVDLDRMRLHLGGKV